MKKVKASKRIPSYQVFEDSLYEIVYEGRCVAIKSLDRDPYGDGSGNGTQVQWFKQTDWDQLIADGSFISDSPVDASDFVIIWDHTALQWRATSARYTATALAANPSEAAVALKLEIGRFK